MTLAKKNEIKKNKLKNNHKLGEFISWGNHPFEVTLMRVTPKMANTWFNNTRELVNEGRLPQRLVSHRVTQYLSRVMNDDQFMTTHQGICLHEIDGKTAAADGQHRLATISDTGKSQLMFVFRNFPADIFKGIDSVSVRKANDAFMCLPGRTGRFSRSTAARITNIAKIVMSNRGMDTKNPVNVAEFANVHRHFMAITTIDQKLRLGKKQLHPYAVAAFVNASLWAEEKEKDDLIMSMVDRFSKQKWDGEDDIMLTLREEFLKFIQVKSETKKSPKAKQYYLATTEAIRAGINEEKLVKFTYKVKDLS